MKNNFKTFILLAGLTALFLFGGQVLGGKQGMLIGLTLAVVMNFAGYWFSDKIALSMSRAQEVSVAEAPELHRSVEFLAQRAGIPKPRVYVIPDYAPNAFATGRNPQNAAVAVTEGILQILSREELDGVIAHELAHIKNRDILISSVAAMLAGALTMLADMAQWTMIFGGHRDDEQGSNPLAAIVMMIVAPLAAMLIQMAISRSREFQADAVGAQICGNPLALANALRKLHMGSQRIPMRTAGPATAHLYIVPPRFGGLAGLFMTHPATEERIRRLEAMSNPYRRAI